MGPRRPRDDARLALQASPEQWERVAVCVVGEFFDEFKQGVAIERPARVVVDGQVVASAGQQECQRLVVAAAQVPAGGGELDEALVVIAIGGVVGAPGVFPGFVSVPVIASIKQGDARAKVRVHVAVCGSAPRISTVLPSVVKGRWAATASAP